MQRSILMMIRSYTVWSRNGIKSKKVGIIFSSLGYNLCGSDQKQSRNLIGAKSTENIKGKVTDYYLKDRLNSKRDYMHGTIDHLNFEETKASTSRLKDTLEKITIERDHIKDDRDKLLQLLDNQDDCNYKLTEDELEIGEQIGWGAYAAVYKANFYGSEVAVKRFNKTDERSLRIYANEVKILKT